MEPIKTVLGSAAKYDDGKPLALWFKNPEKLVRAALQDSDPGKEIKRLIRKLITDIASKDDEFRVELKKDLDELGKGKNHRPGYPRWFRMMVFDEVVFWRHSGMAKNLPEAFMKSADIHRDLYPDITDDAIRGIYQRELKSASAHKTP